MNKAWCRLCMICLWLFKLLPTSQQLTGALLHYSTRGCCIMGYPPETHLKLKNRLSTICFSVAQSFWNFAQSTAVVLPCSVQNFKMMGQLKLMSWMTRFEFMFWRAILYCNRPWVGISSGEWAQSRSEHEIVLGLVQLNVFDTMRPEQNGWLVWRWRFQLFLQRKIACFDSNFTGECHSQIRDDIFDRCGQSRVYSKACTG